MSNVADRVSARHLLGGGHVPDNIDDAKGTMKERAGEALGDKDLQREGEVDQGVGKVKDATDSVGDKAKDLLDTDK